MSKKYIVNENDGVVVRVEERPDYYDGCEDFMADARKALPREQYMIVREADIVLGNLYSPIKSIARLSEDDEWDEEIGKKVADSKYERKRHERVIRQANLAKKLLLKTIAGLDEIIARHEKKRDALVEDYQKYFVERKV